MEISNGVLRIIFKRLIIKEKIKWMRLSKQFQTVLDDMFTKQRKLCIGHPVPPSYSAEDESHEVSRLDSLVFNSQDAVTFLDRED